MISEFWNRVRLNARAIHLAMTGKWLHGSDVASAYDAVASTYDQRWLVHLQSTTDRLHAILPKVWSAGFDNDNKANAVDADVRLLELGCGSGYSTVFLRNQYPNTPLVAVDISQGMIEKAQKKMSVQFAPVQFRCGDMLDVMRQYRDGEFRLIFSGWAIGYSKPTAIIAEAARLLEPHGTLAVIVNRFGTMPAVFRVFRQAMRRFPDQLNKAVWPRFPKGKDALLATLKHNHFRVDFVEESQASIEPPQHHRLDWLLGTGVLAGFDSVLPLNKPGSVRDFFAEELDRSESGWEHHYVMFVATRQNNHR